MERTISAMIGKGSVNHNTRAFAAKNVDKTRSADNVEFCQVGDEERDDVAQLLLEEQLNCIKTHMKDVLNKREIYIICGRYGLGGGKEKTQNELADKLGISRSYVSRIEQKALEKLYNLLGSYRLL